MNGYVAAFHPAYFYPAVGDARPPGGAKCLLLTIGGICVVGPWADDGRFLAWAPLPKRDKAKEELLATQGTSA